MSLLNELCKKTNTIISDWIDVDFIETGIGIERMYENINTGKQFYCVDDQGFITISEC